jgi:hypothetical protein
MQVGNACVVIMQLANDAKDVACLQAFGRLGAIGAVFVTFLCVRRMRFDAIALQRHCSTSSSACGAPLKRTQPSQVHVPPQRLTCVGCAHCHNLHSLFPLSVARLAQEPSNGLIMQVTLLPKRNTPLSRAQSRSTCLRRCMALKSSGATCTNNGHAAATPASMMP